MKKPIIILGAGLAGLTAAYHLKKDYLLIEKEERSGGLTRSINDHGFIFDHAPHILYPKDAYTGKLIKRLLKGNVHSQNREAWIYHRKYRIFTRFPFQSHLYGLPDEVVNTCITELKKALMRKARRKQRTYYEWIITHLGKGIAREFLVPYSQKLWTVHPRSMNCAWLANRIFEVDLEGVVKGAHSDNSKKYGINKEFWYPLRGGMGAVSQVMERTVRKKLRLNTVATKINPREKVVIFNSSEKQEYNCLISSLPLPSLVKMIHKVPVMVKSAVRSLKYNSVLCVNIALKRSHITNKHWIYFHDDYYLFNRISFPMNFSPHTVPGNESSICCEITYSRTKPLNKRNIVRRVINQLIDAGIITKKDTILHTHTLTLDYAYVIYDLHHKRNVSVIHRYLKKNNIIPVGRFGEWEYFNMDDAMLSGKRGADFCNRHIQ